MKHCKEELLTLAGSAFVSNKKECKENERIKVTENRKEKIAFLYFAF